MLRILSGLVLFDIASGCIAGDEAVFDSIFAAVTSVQQPPSSRLSARGPGMDQFRRQPPDCPAGTTWQARYCAFETTGDRREYEDECLQPQTWDTDSGMYVASAVTAYGRCPKGTECEAALHEEDGYPHIKCIKVADGSDDDDDGGESSGGGLNEVGWEIFKNIHKQGYSRAEMDSMNQQLGRATGRWPWAK